MSLLFNLISQSISILLNPFQTPLNLVEQKVDTNQLESIFDLGSDSPLLWVLLFDLFGHISVDPVPETSTKANKENGCQSLVSSTDIWSNITQVVLLYFCFEITHLFRRKVHIYLVLHCKSRKVVFDCSIHRFVNFESFKLKIFCSDRIVHTFAWKVLLRVYPVNWSEFFRN